MEVREKSLPYKGQPFALDMIEILKILIDKCKIASKKNY